MELDTKIWHLTGFVASLVGTAVSAVWMVTNAVNGQKAYALAYAMALGVCLYVMLLTHKKATEKTQ